MTRFFAAILFIFLSITLVKAQDGQNSSQGDLLQSLMEEGPRGQVTLELDSQLLANYNKMIARNMGSTGVPGYRIRIYSGSGVGAKEEQQRVRARFLSLYRGLDAYNRYDEPFFKVYIGDCRTRSEALKLNDRIKKDFPNPIIVSDYINLKSTE
ncbi:MAG: SPOR domain-containing protein [Bacteroidales bacterium]|nr:SPOR domain-containing protein [Bacteroidales bacterium]